MEEKQYLYSLFVLQVKLHSNRELPLVADSRS